MSKIKLTKPTKVVNNIVKYQKPKSVVKPIIKPITSVTSLNPQVAITRSYQAPAIQQSQPIQYRKEKTSKSSLSVAIESANAIASNRAHPNHTEVEQLLRTLEKGWINEKKFLEVLPTLLF